uniref:Leucine rich repeat containing 73 n=1 Tax=Mus musculus TaxID=10090 RepID=A0A3B2W7N5_MOUSE
MLPSSIQISGEPLSGAEVRDICRGLRDNAVRLLSLRGCRLCDRDFGRICRALAGATSLAQLNLNLGVVSSPSRIKQLAEALRTNRSIQSLLSEGANTERQPWHHPQGLEPPRHCCGPQLPSPRPQPGLQPPGRPCGRDAGCSCGLKPYPRSPRLGGHRAHQPVSSDPAGHGRKLPNSFAEPGVGREQH